MVEKSIGVYGSWFEKISEPYTNLLKNVLLRLRSVPRYPSVILERDVAIIVGFCKLFDIQYDREILKNREYFSTIKYAIIREIKKVAEEKLKPEDPLFRFIKEQQLSEEEMRAYMQQMERKDDMEKEL